MALNALANQQAANSMSVASRAVDGDFSTNMCTNVADKPWCYVDLSYPHYVTAVNVTNYFISSLSNY
jgi:hypothetical protein